MTDASDADVEPVQDSAPAEEPKKKRRGRRWTRWFGWMLGILIVGRVAIGFAAEPIARSVASNFGIDLRWDDLDLSVHSGRVEIWGLHADVAGEEGEESEPLFHARTVAFDLDVGELFSGVVRVTRLELDGAEVEVARDEDGRWSFAPVLETLAAGEKDAPEPEPEKDEELGPIVLESPIQIVAARAQDISIHFRDAVPDPPVDVTSTVSISAADVAVPGREGKFDVVATSPEILDLFRIQGRGGTEGSTADLAFDFQLSRLDLRPLSGVLATFGVDPIARSIDASGAAIVDVDPVDETARELRGTFVVDGAKLTHDGLETLALDALRVDVAAASPERIDVRSIEVEGPRARAERLADGSLAVAGLALRGGADGAAAPAAEAPSEDASDVEGDASEGPSKPFEWGVESVEVRGGEVALDDLALVPTVELAAVLDELTLGPVRSGQGAPPSDVSIIARVPGVLGHASLEGTIRSVVPAPSLTLRASANEIDPERIEPYLALAGLESVLEAGTLSLEQLDVEGAPDGRLEISARGFALSDGRELGAIDVMEVAVAPGEDPVIAVTGVRSEMKRRKDGTFEALGIVVGGDPPQPTLASAPADEVQTVDRTAPRDDTATAEAKTDAEGDAAFSLPEIILPEATFQLERFAFIDEVGVVEPLTLGPVEGRVAPAASSTGAGGRAYDLEVDGAVDLADDLEAKLRLEQAPNGRLRVAGEASATGLDLEPVRALLESAGIEPVLESGAFSGELDVAVDADAGRPRVDVDLGPFRLANGGSQEGLEWVGLDRFSVDGLVVGDTIEIAAIEAVAPRIALQRDAEGGFRALGLRVIPPSESVDETDDDEAPASKWAEPQPSAPDGKDAVERDTAPAPAAGAITIGRVALVDAQARIEDEALDAPHSFTLGADLTLESVSPGVGAEPMSVDGTVRVDDAALTSQGDVVLDPQDLRLAMTVSGERLDGTAIAPYLPPTVDIVLEEGTLAARFEARAAQVDAGGWALSMNTEAVELRSANAERPLLALDAMSVEVPRVDPEGGAYELDRATVAGLVIDVVRTTEGGFRALGVEVTPPEESGEESELPEVEPVEPVEKADPLAGAGGSTGAGRSEIPLIRIDEIDLGIDELRFSDETRPGAAPTVAGATLNLTEPYLLDVEPDDDAGEMPALGLEAHLSITPGLASSGMEFRIQPFEDSPRLDASIELSGISGQDLLAIAPELRGTFAATNLTEGTFQASMHTALDWRRRGPLDFDVSGGFGGELYLEDVAFRKSPGAEPAFGVERVEVTARRIVPETGRAHLARVEVQGLQGSARRLEEGLSVGGIVLLLAPPSEDADAEPDEATEDASDPGEPSEVIEANAPILSEETPADVADVGATVAPSRKAPPEVRIDSFLVDGIDFVIEDTTVDPVFVMPLTELGIDVRGFTTRALTDPVPVRFSAYLGAGDITLPERLEQISVLRGVATGIAATMAGKGDDEELEFEERPLFYEITASGRMALVPAPRGWVRTNVAGFELMGMRGYARDAGVDVGDGLLDANVRVRFNGDQSGNLDSLFSFSHLSLDEPDGGPISKFLKLPASLDKVLFVLENEQGEHRIPLDFNFDPEGVGAGAIAAEASSTFLGLVTEALASAPTRAVGQVTDLVGLGNLLNDNDRKPKLAGKLVEIEFDPGDTYVTPKGAEQLDEIVSAMLADPLLELVGVHALSDADVDRAAELSSPDRHEAERVLRSLRRRRDEIMRQRDEVAVVARTQLLLGQSGRYRATRETLVSFDRELRDVEAGIDRVAELLRPGVEERSDRRTRLAALALAGTRLDAVRRTLLDAGVPFERVSLREPRFEVPDDSQEGAYKSGAITLLTKAGTPPKSLFRRLFGWLPGL